MKRAGGCGYETRKGSYDTSTEHCNRIVAAGKDFCPKHLVMIEGGALEVEKKMQKLRDRKAFKAEMREALKSSPLRGYNPKFSGTGYER